MPRSFVLKRVAAFAIPTLCDATVRERWLVTGSRGKGRERRGVGVWGREGERDGKGVGGLKKSRGSTHLIPLQDTLAV